MSNASPREFWITVSRNLGDKYNGKICTTHTSLKVAEDYCEEYGFNCELPTGTRTIVHVIEISAVQKLQEQLEEARADLSKEQATVDYLTAQLKEKHAVANRILGKCICAETNARNCPVHND